MQAYFCLYLVSFGHKEEIHLSSHKRKGGIYWVFMEPVGGE